ncbi:MAG TPA: hypothetical protein VM204_07230 [Gaiellaceae bacterium]|nr:hypothetical protein [Gaiellaceae bacterium]
MAIFAEGAAVPTWEGWDAAHERERIRRLHGEWHDIALLELRL